MKDEEVPPGGQLRGLSKSGCFEGRWRSGTFMFALPPRTSGSVFTNRKCPCVTNPKSPGSKKHTKRDAMFYRTLCHIQNKAAANKGHDWKLSFTILELFVKDPFL